VDAPSAQSRRPRAIIAGGLATGFLAFAAPAQAAPTGPGNAADTISSLDDRIVYVTTRLPTHTTKGAPLSRR
jgi:hypothetical protein